MSKCKCAECRDVTLEPDCPACAEPYQAGQECQQKPWAEFREYLPVYCMTLSKCNRCGAPIFSDECVDDQPCLDCIMGEDPVPDDGAALP